MLVLEIEKSGETRGAWAKKIGVSQGFLSNLLNGKRQPSLEVACKIESLTDGRVPAGSWLLGRQAVATVDQPAARKDTAA